MFSLKYGEMKPQDVGNFIVIFVYFLKHFQILLNNHPKKP